MTCVDQRQILEILNMDTTAPMVNCRPSTRAEGVRISPEGFTPKWRLDPRKAFTKCIVNNDQVLLVCKSKPKSLARIGNCLGVSQIISTPVCQITHICCHGSHFVRAFGPKY